MARVIERQKIYEIIISDVNNYLTYDIDRVIEILKDWKKTYSTYQNIWLETEYNYESSYLVLKGERLQNDAEYDKYCALIKKQKAAKKVAKKTAIEKERAEYERLKKKFG